MYLAEIHHTLSIIIPHSYPVRHYIYIYIYIYIYFLSESESGDKYKVFFSGGDKNRRGVGVIVREYA